MDVSLHYWKQRITRTSDLPRNRLISSRIDQKFVFNGRIHRFFKEKLARRSWAIDAVVGADLRRRGGDSLGRLHGSRIGREFRFNFASTEASIALDHGHDQAAISP